MLTEAENAAVIHPTGTGKSFIGFKLCFHRCGAELWRSGVQFCANGEHMKEMIEKVPAWFAKADAEPYVYSAYSNAPETSQASASFNADTSNHLKLLFCIDMLNESIHGEDIDGGILHRLTVSPILCKQHDQAGLIRHQKQARCHL